MYFHVLKGKTVIMINNQFCVKTLTIKLLDVEQGYWTTI